MNEPNTGGYYAVIPATVRYDAELPANAKLLYGEITALANTSGYCWAQNSYFTELYNVSERSVSRWIELLCKKGYLKRKVERNERREVTARRLYVNDVSSVNTPPDKNVTTSCHTPAYPPDKNVTTSRQNCQNPPDKIGGENNTGINNTKENTRVQGEMKNVHLSDAEFDKLTARFGRPAVLAMIDELSLYISSSGKRYKSHYATLLSWLRKNGVSKPDASASENHGGLNEWM